MFFNLSMILWVFLFLIFKYLWNVLEKTRVSVCFYIFWGHPLLVVESLLRIWLSFWLNRWDFSSGVFPFQSFIDWNYCNFLLGDFFLIEIGEWYCIFEFWVLIVVESFHRVVSCAIGSDFAFSLCSKCVKCQFLLLLNWFCGLCSSFGEFLINDQMLMMFVFYTAQCCWVSADSDGFLKLYCICEWAQITLM